MSLIDQALKKTQSALHQKRRNVPPAQPNVDKPEPIRPAVHAIPRKYQKTKSHTVSDFTFNHTDLVNFVTNRWVIGAASFIFLLMLTLTTHQYFLYIKEQYIQFYGQLFQHLLPAKHKPVATPKPVAPIIPLQLNGTLQMKHQHVALINHQLYHAGEMIDGYKIEQIRYNHVDLLNLQTHQKRELTPELSQ